MQYYSQINLNSEVTLMVELNKIKDDEFVKVKPVEHEVFNFDFYNEYQQSKVIAQRIHNKSAYYADINSIRVPNFVASMINKHSSVFNQDIEINTTAYKNLPANLIMHKLPIINKIEQALVDVELYTRASNSLIIDYLKYIYIISSTDEEYFHVISPMQVKIKAMYDYNQSINKQVKDNKINNLKYYKFKNEDYDIVVKNLLLNLLDSTIERTSVGDALRELWLYQIQQQNLIEDTSITRINSNLNQIIEKIIPDISSHNNNQYIKKITYRQLFDFFKEVNNQLITESTKDAQEWLKIENKGVFVETMIQHENFNQLNASIKDITSSMEGQQIINELNRDSHFKHRHNINKIFEINKSRENRFDGRLQLIHGSINNSIISILLNGLKTNKSLRTEKINHKYTGSGLGYGVYFASLDECSKSSNYTGNSKSGYHYMLIADVDFDTKNVYKTKQYNSSLNTSKYSLIIGDKVGSKDLSEYVAPHDDQINVRYLVEYK